MEEQSSPDCEDRHKVIRCPYWWKIKIGDGDALYGKFLTESAAQEVAFLLRREFRNGEYLAQARIAELEARCAELQSLFYEMAALADMSVRHDNRQEMIGRLREKYALAEGGEHG